MDEQVTSLLNSMRQGDDEAVDRLIPMVYSELRKIAASMMKAERQDQVTSEARPVFAYATGASALLISVQETGGPRLST
jgi:hypothetical protein